MRGGSLADRLHDNKGGGIGGQRGSTVAWADRLPPAPAPQTPHIAQDMLALGSSQFVAVCVCMCMCVRAKCDMQGRMAMGGGKGGPHPRAFAVPANHRGSRRHRREAHVLVTFAGLLAP